MGREPHRKPFQRLLLKLSGEALGGGKSGIDPDAARFFISEVTAAVDTGCQIAIVCGGGNIFRGKVAADLQFDRTAADTMGMLATMINGIALREVIRATGYKAEVVSALPIVGAMEPFNAETVRALLASGNIVILTAGTGQPFFSTDTGAALRALQIQADIFIKATKVDGVYDSDPVQNPNARFYRSLNYDTVLEHDLRVMDAASVALCREHKLPVLVLNLNRPGTLLKGIKGEDVGTLISDRGDEIS